MTFQKAIIVLVLEGFPNNELVAFNLAIHFPGYDLRKNLSYKRALDGQLIDEQGKPLWNLEDLQSASAYEVNRRINKGIFT